MTSSPVRGRPRRTTARTRVRVARAVLGALAAAGWWASPVWAAGAQGPVPAAVHAGAGAAAPEQDETSAADLVLPLVAGAGAVTLAAYGCVRRVRRARTRTTPGIVSARPPAPTPADSERQARAALVLADECVRTSREELSFVRDRFGKERTEPFARALRAAETELSAAFALWRRYEQGVPEEAGARRQALVGVVGRCAEAGRRLDAEAAALDALRDLAEWRVGKPEGEGPPEAGQEPDARRGDGGRDPAGVGRRGREAGGPDRWAEGKDGVGAALEVAEGRFREAAARTVAAQETLAALRRRYPPSATASVTGYLEQAKDRLVFATARLNEAHQTSDAGDGERAAGQLRAAEGAVARCEVLAGAVERLAAQLREAAALVPAALTGAEAELARVRGGRAAPAAQGPQAGLRHADGVLAAVREELTGASYDPLDALDRITRAVERPAGTPSGVLGAAALLVARARVAGAEEFVAVHRGAVGAPARARLAEAVRELGAGDALRAGSAAGEARELAERDLLEHGHPYAGAEGGAAGPAGAVLGGILLGEDADGGPPAAFGGPRTRSRRRL
ncbi:hypothetical protein [Streptomyces sp. NPDC006193]|uniref:hypothetical protein n=1 Tax=Streptomyces sp. NPDC006193 TaxID=3155717 RepID=UPI0033B0B330